MHEVFFDAIIAQEDLEKTARVLQGYCNMAPVSFLRRKLFWEGPPGPDLKGLNLQHENIQRAIPAKKALWKNLHDNLCTQSYILTLTYDLDQEKQLGKRNSDEEGPELDCDQLHGTLRWNDIPDPGANKVAHSRIFVSIEKETKLCEILKASNYRFFREIIEEVHRFVHNHTMFELYRPLQIPSLQEENCPPSIRTRLPSFEKLRLFDSEEKWILRANAIVLDGTDQDQMNEGVKLLSEIKSDFEGFVNFDIRSRFLHDTRTKQ
ncbi:hypothetical protein K3495_g6593 [Podosphaera aphanis]|nr:hypothetical protein K3495_g6593 [Podosphaera aphanis]